MSKPTNKPGWNPTDSSKVVEPSSTKKAQGWAAGEKPAAEHFNWLMKTVSEWIDYVDTVPTGGELSAEDEARIAALEASVGVIAPSPVTVTFPYLGGAAPSEYDAGAVIPSNAKTIDWANGASQYMLLDADCALSFSNPVAGNTYYLRIQQGGYGLKRVIGWPTNIIWNSGSVPTISTAAWTVDVIGCYYDGNNYYGYVSQGHFNAPTGIDVKNGYIAGGFVPHATASAASGIVEKINFNADETLSVVQTEFGYELNNSGAYAYPSITTTVNPTNVGVGTQSATHGYRLSATYTSLPTITGLDGNEAAHKMPFSNDTTSVIVRFTTSPATLFVSAKRRGATQSSTFAYSHNTTQFAKLSFQTDAQSTITAVSTIANSSVNMGSSTPTVGIYIGGANGAKTQILNFSTESISDGKYLLSFNAVASEIVESDYNAYYQRTTTTTAPGVTLLEKMDKSIYSFNTISSTLAGYGSGATATQGSFAGYFCGGQAYPSGTTQGQGLTELSSSSIRKINFATEAAAIHGVSLGNARINGAGFEG